MRKPVMAGNWKMNMTRDEALQFIYAVSDRLPSIDVLDSVICAPAIILRDLVKRQGDNLRIGGQNLHQAEKGAFTGEISAKMLTSTGVEYVIIGHSERRQYFNETDEAVNKKAKVLLENGITPVICVGETLEEREANIYMGRIEDQVRQAIENIDIRFVDKIIIAYEPIWAIGTGKTATKEQAEEMCSHIRYNVAKMYGLNVADNVRIQYGGSVNEANAKELFEMPNIDGALVGGASLKPTFTNIIKAAR